MPYNSGIFSLVPSYKAVAGATIRTENHNAPLEDIANGLSSVITRDGTSSMVGPLNMGGFPVSNLGGGTASSDAATVGQVVPVGAVIDFAGSTAPTGWLFCYGQAISRTTYAVLFAAIGTAYGVGDGSTTFNVPDLRGRVGAGRDNMGGTAAGRLGAAVGFNGDAKVLGTSGGLEYHTLAKAELPAVSPVFTGITGAVTVVSTTSNWMRSSSFVTVTGSSTSILNGDVSAITSTGFFTPSGTIAPLGSGTSHNNVQPTIVMNKIIRASY